MSKALNPLSIAVGKLGNAVYYKLKYSGSGQKQGIREYVPQPSNPQTTPQIDQRIKMTAVTSCYRAFGDVIRRAFEGVEYGQPSYARWSSLALGASFQGPFLEKDQKIPCPVIGVPMAIGSLPTVTVEQGTDMERLKTSLYFNGTLNTIGELSEDLLNRNSWLQTGDQLTLCVISTSSVPHGNIFAQSWSFYLNINSTSTIPPIAGTLIATQGGFLGFDVDDNIPLCACVIVSREGSHLRSTSYWGYNGSFIQIYAMTNTDEKRDTYRKTTRGVSTDWPVDPSATPSQGSVTARTADNIYVDLYNLRVDNGYLVASGRNHVTQVSMGEFFFKCTDVKSWMYNQWLTGFSSAGTEAPTESDADTIPFLTIDTMTDTQKALYRWLVSNGVNEYWLLTGQTV